MKNPETANTLPTEELLRHVGWLQGLARSLVLDDGEADDAVQETWLSALSAKNAVRQPRAWLAGTLRNKMQGRRRSEGRRREHEALAADASSSHAPEASLSLQVLERQRVLIDHVEALPETQRQAILARYYEGLAPREIARREGLRVETVKDRLKRGLQSLRGELDREHGDRAAWAGWLLPLAVETKQKAALGAITFAASVLVSLTVAAVLVSSLHKETQPQSETEVVAASAMERSVEPRDESESVITPARDESRVAISSPQEGRSFLILEQGEPALHATVSFISIEAVGKLSASGEVDLHDIERLCSEHGTAVQVDEAGKATIAADPPYFFRASTARGIGALLVTEDEPTREVSIVSTPRIRVRVVDHANEPVPDVEVRGEIVLYRHDEGGSTRSNQTFAFLREASAEAASFQDPMAVTSVWTERTAHGEEYSWKEFRVHVPGVPETETASRARVDVPLNAESEESTPIRLVMPPVGSLRLQISGSPEERSEFAGVASLRVMESGRTAGDSFEATISGGEARWPRIAPGVRVSIDVHLPVLGLEWSVEGRVEGLEETVLQTTQPSRAVLSGRLVDENGLPHPHRSLWAYHGEDGTSEMRRGVQFETEADGSFRFSWTSSEEVSSPLHLVIESVFDQGRWSKGAVAIDLGSQEMIKAIDLGEITLAMRPPEALRGQVVDPAGNALNQVQVRSRGNLGNSWSVMSDDEGRFQMTPIWHDSISLDLTDMGRRYPDASVELRRADLEDPLVITMTNGGRIRGRMRPSNLNNSGEAYGVRIAASNGEELRILPFGPGGSFDSGALGENTWSLSIVGGGLGVITGLGEYTLRAGESVELDLPSMEELFRTVIVVPLSMPEGTLISSDVFNETGSLMPDRYGFPVLIPREGEWKVRLSAHGRRTVVVAASEISERYELHLPQALQVRLVSVVPLPSDYDLALRGEPGAENADQYISFPEPSALGIDIAIPMPGRYRLHRVAKAETDLGDPGPGIHTAAALQLEATTQVIEVKDSEALQEFDIDFAAPLVSGSKK